MNFQITPMTLHDYPEVIELWQETEGVGLSDADSEHAIGRYLERNPGFSFVAREGDRLVGAVLCGHDGRRGYLHHLAVHPQYRRCGIGKQLTERCMQQLQTDGIDKCHIFVFDTNESGLTFWRQVNFEERSTLVILSRSLK